MQTLTVVNEMLGTLGETPLASLTDTHRFLSACLDGLEEANRSVQARGWWFNLEDTTLTPSVIDGGLYIPNDCLSVRTPLRTLVKRGDRLYNLEGGTFVFTAPVDVILIRQVEFEDLPEVAASLVSATAVLAFQTNLDGDQQKTRLLAEKLRDALAWANTEHTRERRSNLLLANTRLQRIKRITNASRRWIR